MDGGSALDADLVAPANSAPKKRQTRLYSFLCSRQRPFLPGDLGMISPQLVLYVIIGTAIAGYVYHCEYVKKDRAQFIARLEAQAEQQKKDNQAKEKKDKLAKEKADAQNQTALNRLRADNQRLRDERTRTSILPPAPAAAKSPGRITLDRTLTERALSAFVEGASQLVAEGDHYRVNLNTAKEWSNSVLRLRLSEQLNLPSSKLPENTGI